jgi:GT2 family glycosyltransferase
MKPKVSILLLTFNTLTKVGENFTKLMIESIFRQDYPNLTLIVIDNHSQDNTLAYLEKLISDHASTEFHMIKLAKNYGYTGGNNRGAMYAHLHKVEYLFFMNDDIILLDKNLITTLIENLEKNKDIGAVQPLIINKGGSLNCGFQSGFSSLSKVSKDGRGIFFISGAAFLTRTKTFIKIGMFDPDFFLYYDDVDYSWRLWLTGYKVKCVNEVRAYHIGGTSLRVENPRLYYFVLRNAVWTIAKNSSMSMFIPRLALLFSESFISFILHHAFIKRDPRLLKADIQGLVEGIKNLSTAISKRIFIQKNRKVPERFINKIMDVRVDVELLFPRTLRRILLR